MRLAHPEVTLRQLSIWRLLAQGKTDKEIARELGIAKGSVRAHLSELFWRIGVRNRTEAAVWYARKESAPEGADIVFPHFWMFKNEGGWRWVSRDGTRSSRAAFDFAPQCALDAERTLAAPPPPDEGEREQPGGEQH